MIPYDLIIPSASRPHMLDLVLSSLHEFVDVPPAHVILHDDEAFPGRQTETIAAAIRGASRWGVSLTLETHKVPIYHGPALAWLLSCVTTDYVLYCQDDQRPTRPLPIARALDLMRDQGINQIRFNKRETMADKGGFRKVAVDFGGPVLCISDHWYFQLGLWRVAQIKPIVDYWATQTSAFREHCEIKINRTMNGEVPAFSSPTVMLPPAGSQWDDPEVRRKYQRTYIWGPVGEPAFLENLAWRSEDWALPRNRGGVGIREDFPS